MLEIKQCCGVLFSEKLFEEYEVREDAIFANINASRVLDMMKCFAGMRDEPMFFVLEFPCREEDDITQSKIPNNVNDYDVYFIDGLDKEGGRAT